MGTTHDELAKKRPTSVIPRLTRDLRSTQEGFKVGRWRIKSAMTEVGEGAPEKRFVIIDLFAF
ncbi:hypothetical protein [Parabacteroides pacaensis]|uniref:hypothetical protein n=1 Tax=Parabacteroides pacaensis TaxID=2086575 RepID=UPI000D0ED894|nr:hypothetical protein [Parabacteroides pacaensis]